jgi:hypothetical protein
MRAALSEQLKRRDGAMDFIEEGASVVLVAPLE